MAFDDTDRPRVLLAVVLTLIAAPVLWLASRPSDDAEPNVEASSAPIRIDEAAETSVAEPVPDPPVVTVGEPNLPPVEAPDADPIFMDGPAAEPISGTPEVAVPARPAIDPLVMAATYRSTIEGARSCFVRGVTTGITVTVKNLNNGREVTCVTTIAPPDQIDDVVMHTRTFELLADLTDAPIPVEVRR